MKLEKAYYKYGDFTLAKWRNRWSPWHLRSRIKALKEALDNNAYGWSNCHQELLEARKRIDELQS
jgi:hypothetical protein